LKIVEDIAKKVQARSTMPNCKEKVHCMVLWSGLYVSLKKKTVLSTFLFVISFLFLSECQTLNAFFSRYFHNAKYLGNGWTNLL